MNHNSEIFISESDFRNRYQYDENDLLGEGGFAQVYKAFDKQFQEYVALKFYNKGEQSKYDVLHEMKDSRKFSHPNIIRIQDAFVVRFEHAGGHSYVQVGILEFANGGNLRDFIKTKPNEEKFIEVLTGILNGLDYLHHEKKMIHRDLSPENILMFNEEDNWIPKIADFGISKRVDYISDARDRTKSAQLLGKVDYMAPEQFYPEKFGIDGKINTNVDLWAFGVILYELFMRERPFDHDAQDNPLKIIQSIVHDQVPKLAEILEPYHTAIKRCLEKKAFNRVKSAGELVDILQRYSVKKPSLTQPKLWNKYLKIKRIPKHYFYIGFLALFVLVFVGYFLTVPSRKKEPVMLANDHSAASIKEISLLIEKKDYDSAINLISRLPENIRQQQDIVNMQQRCLHYIKLDSMLTIGDQLFEQKAYNAALMSYSKIVNEFDSSNTLAKSRIDTIRSVLKLLNAPKIFRKGIYRKDMLSVRVNPETKAVELESIEISDAATIISLKLKAGESRLFSSAGQSGAYYIVCKNGNQRLDLKDITGIRTGIYRLEEKDKVFQLFFDKLPENVVEFNLINGDALFHKNHQFAADFVGISSK